VTLIFGFAMLILLTFTAYRNAPPGPSRVGDTSGAVVFTGDDIRSGQSVFLEYDKGTIWGHGGYLGPDFGATVLHDWARIQPITCSIARDCSSATFRSRVAACRGRLDKRR
jgi:nitric oxide reductase subunit B